MVVCGCGSHASGSGLEHVFGNVLLGNDHSLFASVSFPVAALAGQEASVNVGVDGEKGSVGIRRKAILAVAGTVAVVQLGGGLAGVRTERELLLAEAVARGQQVQRALAVPCSVALANREMETLDAVIARFAEQEGADLDLEGLAILDTSGRVVAHTSPRLFGQKLSDSFTERALASDTPLVEEVRDDAGARMLLSMPIVSGLRWGTATAVMSLGKSREPHWNAAA